MVRARQAPPHPPDPPPLNPTEPLVADPGSLASQAFDRRPPYSAEAEISVLGGDVAKFVSPTVSARLKVKIRELGGR